MKVHSNTIERTYVDGKVYRRRVTMIDTDFVLGDVIPKGQFWAGWTVIAVVEC